MRVPAVFWGFIGASGSVWWFSALARCGYFRTDGESTCSDLGQIKPIFDSLDRTMRGDVGHADLPGSVWCGHALHHDQAGRVLCGAWAKAQELRQGVELGVSHH